jgi:hypothetical protein
MNNNPLPSVVMKIINNSFGCGKSFDNLLPDTPSPNPKIFPDNVGEIRDKVSPCLGGREKDIRENGMNIFLANYQFLENVCKFISGKEYIV